MRRMLLLFPTLLFLSVVTLCAAAEGAPWYQVEVIVFTRPADPAHAGQYQPDAPLLEGIRQALHLQAPGASTAFSRLPSDRLRLNEEYRRLRSRQSPLHPVLHEGWRQPVRSRGNAQAVYLSGGPEQVQANPTAPDAAGFSSLPQIEGTLRVDVARYLHLDLDLLLREPGSATEQTIEAPPNGGLRTYRLDELRRARSGELHYFDHPLFGALVLVTPWGDQAARPAASGPEDEPPAPEATPGDTQAAPDAG